MPVSASIRQTASMTLERKEEKLNKNEKKQRKKLLQNKESLKKQKEDLKSISISQKKMKKANISKEKGKPKKKLSFFGGKKKKSVQETIPYLRMLRNGICQVEKNKFNKMIRFLDINYQLSTEEDLSLIHISEPTRHTNASRMPSSA